MRPAGLAASWRQRAAGLRQEADAVYAAAEPGIRASVARQITRAHADQLTRCAAELESQVPTSGMREREAPDRERADAATLDRIAEMLRDPEWGAGMLEDIAELITQTGRSAQTYPDDRPTWNRH